MSSIVIASRAVFRSVLAVAVAATTLTACGTDQGESAAPHVGTVTIPLQAEVDGTRYRLGAVLDITGGQGGVTTLATTPDQPTLVATLPVGQYTATLVSFTLFKDDGTGTFHAVEATVESSSQSFGISNDSSTTISFQFDTDGTVVPVGSGNVNVTFGVTDTSCDPIVVDATQRTARSERFFLDFSNRIPSNPEEIDVLQWAGGPNLAEVSAADACTNNNVEFFGNSWVPPDPNIDGPDGVLVGAGSTGTWAQDGASIVIQSMSSGCTASADTPVQTRYRFREGIGRDTIEVERQFDFSVATEFSGFRPFIPRLTVAFDQVIHPDATGTTLRSDNVLDCPYGCDESDWDHSWFAYYATTGSFAGQGMIVLHAPSTSPAYLWVDNDIPATEANASSVLLAPPGGYFRSKLVDRELLCFFDATTWNPTGQAVPALPPGCTLDLACDGAGTERGAQATNERKLPLNDLPGGGTFAGAVALADDRLLVAHGNGSVGGTQAEVFVRSGADWISEARLAPSNVGLNGGFGGAVALANDLALVGAPTEGDAGAVFAFKRSGSTWTELAKIEPPDGVNGESFGSSLTFNGGEVMIGSDGLVRFYLTDGDGWSLLQKIQPPAGASQNGFGRSALADGTLVIGSLRDTVGDNAEQGSVYVYDETKGPWAVTQRLVADDGQANDHFGNTVAVSGDTILVGADSFAHLDQSGAAYVFVRNAAGSFVQQAKLHSPDGAPEDAFGLVVALRGDRALISASQHEHGGVGTDTGAAYLFQRTQSQWSAVQELTATDPTNHANFGAPLALSLTHAAITAKAGGAYVFDL